jgi:hypothetical protein
MAKFSVTFVASSPAAAAASARREADEEKRADAEALPEARADRESARVEERAREASISGRRRRTSGQKNDTKKIGGRLYRLSPDVGFSPREVSLAGHESSDSTLQYKILR